MARPAHVKAAQAAGCTKRTYKSQTQAEAEADRYWKRNHYVDVLQTAYWCPRCTFWHLTSKMQNAAVRAAFERFEDLQ